MYLLTTYLKIVFCLSTLRSVLLFGLTSIQQQNSLFSFTYLCIRIFAKYKTIRTVQKKDSKLESALVKKHNLLKWCAVAASSGLSGFLTTMGEETEEKGGSRCFEAVEHMIRKNSKSREWRKLEIRKLVNFGKEKRYQMYSFELSDFYGFIFFFFKRLFFFISIVRILVMIKSVTKVGIKDLGNNEYILVSKSRQLFVCPYILFFCMNCFYIMIPKWLRLKFKDYWNR